MTDEELGGATIDQLKDNVPRRQADEELATNLERERLRRLTQANDLREKFYSVAVKFAFATVATSIGLVVAVLCGVTIDPVIASAFISGLAVETVGVLAIMARYLFPQDKGTETNGD